MVIKICVICKKEFDCQGNDITCGEKCSKERKRIYDSRYKHDYNREYYLANSKKWEWYKGSMQRLPVGTTDLTEKLCKNSEDLPDFEKEFNYIRHEMVRLGLRSR